MAFITKEQLLWRAPVWLGWAGIYYWIKIGSKDITINSHTQQPASPQQAHIENKRESNKYNNQIRESSSYILHTCIYVAERDLCIRYKLSLISWKVKAIHLHHLIFLFPPLVKKENPPFHVHIASFLGWLLFNSSIHFNWIRSK